MVGRFAPTPSGRMHLGNVCSAMLAWLSVRSQNGEMVLRIEDLDPNRCRSPYIELLKEDLLWLGLDWDREQTPQRLRTEAYEQVFMQLMRQHLVYPCFCSRDQLHAASAPHADDGQLVYNGRCRSLTPAQRAQQLKPPSWRLTVPDRSFSFLDGLQGTYSQQLSSQCGDFIIRRADGIYAYQLAVVVDDHAGGITEVVRGMDLLSSTPRQLYLHHILGLEPPVYYHVPLILGPDGHRLSKRHRDLDLESLRRTHTAQAILGTLAYLIGLIDYPESVSSRELISAFCWDKVHSSPIILDTFQ